MSEYHSRSIVESVFSSIKRKFASFLRTKSEVAMRNELLAKVVCYNVTCLINAIYELGLEPIFWADKSVAQKVLPA